MRCAICEKVEDETVLKEGLFDGQIRMICGECAFSEHIPLISKPSSESLSGLDKRLSVRETLEEMSKPKKSPRTVTHDQAVTHKNLAKINFPEKRQDHESLIQNYDWKIKISRREKKITINQLAEKTGLEVEFLEMIEKGKLPEKFEEKIPLIENALNIRIRVAPEEDIKFKRASGNQEEEILDSVKEKMDVGDTASKKSLLSKIRSGKVDFSKREEIEDITLSDLVDRKKQKEKDEMFGDEIDLE